METQKLLKQVENLIAARERNPRWLDEICALLSLPVVAVSAILSELEVEGFVQRVPDGYIRRPFPPS